MTRKVSSPVWEGAVRNVPLGYARAAYFIEWVSSSFRLHAFSPVLGRLGAVDQSVQDVIAGNRELKDTTTLNPNSDNLLAVLKSFYDSCCECTHP